MIFGVHRSDKVGREKSYLRRDIPVFRGLQYLNENDHGKVPACSSVYILLYEEWQVFVLENCYKDMGLSEVI